MWVMGCARVDELLSGNAQPVNEKQKRLLRVIAGDLAPATGFELAFARFFYIKKNLIQLEKLEVLQNSEIICLNEKNDLENKYSRLVSINDGLKKNVDLFKDRINISVQSLRRKDYEIAVLKKNYQSGVEDLERKINRLIAHLEKSYEIIRGYESRLGLEFSVPEKFDPEIINKSAPEEFNDELMNRCQACDRPVSSCICSR